MLAERIEKGLAIAGQQTALFVANLAEGTPCSPTLWSFDGEKVATTYLMTPDTDGARRMAKAQIEGASATAQTVTTVYEARLVTGDARADALEIGVSVPGTPVDLALALPYDGDARRFERGALLLRRGGVPEELDLERIRAAFFGAMATAPATIPRTLEAAPADAAIESKPAGVDPMSLLASAAARAEPPSPERVRLASLAPYAAFLLVASADGRVEGPEVQAFTASLAATTHPALLRLLVACPLDPVHAIRVLAADPPLALRALAAAGTVLAADGREAFLEIARTIARSTGKAGEAEEKALAVVSQALDAGDGAPQGPDPFRFLGEDSLARHLELAASAPVAAFLVVAAADGKVETDELRTFVEEIGRTEDPLLAAMSAARVGSLEDGVKQLMSEPARGREALRAAGVLFTRHPLGQRGRRALLAVLRRVAAADGKVTAAEERVIARVEALLDAEARLPGVRLRVALQAAAVLAVLVCGWQLAAVGLRVPAAWFVPVAATIQLLVLLPMLLLTAALGARYGAQVVLGTLASLVAGIPVALGSLLVTVLFPSVLVQSGGSAVAGAISGFVGTAVTGLVISAVAAVVLRRR